MNKKQLIISIAIFIIAFLVTIFISQPEQMTSLGVDEIAVNEITLSDNKLTLNGTLLSSGKSYQGYTYNIAEDELHITLNGGLITEESSSGDFDITINDDKLEDVKAIYLKQDDELAKIYPTE